jgi:hypothetical protein
MCLQTKCDKVSRIGIAAAEGNLAVATRHAIVMAKIERRLVPIVSLDVEGYSRLTQLDEAVTLSAVHHVFTERVEATIGDHGGSIFKTMGDGVLAEFTSVVAAVEWAAQLQQQLLDRYVEGLRIAGWSDWRALALAFLQDQHKEKVRQYSPGPESSDGIGPVGVLVPFRVRSTMKHFPELTAAKNAAT